MMKFLAVVAALVIPPAIYFPTLGAHRDQRVAQAQQQLAELDLRIQMAKTAQRKLPQFRAEMVRLESELGKLHSMLPPVPAIDEIHSMTQSLAAENGIALTHFDPGTLKDDNALQEQTMTAEVVGSAEGTAAFLRQIQTASKIIDVSGVTVTKDPAGWRTDFAMTTYAMK